jgi:hypothetical protein
MISTIRSRKVFKGKVLNKKKRGQLYWMDITIMAFKDLNGKIIKHVAIMFDVNFQTAQKEVLLKRADELAIANTELAFQNKEKGKRADELVLANKEKEKLANELILANKELAFQTELDVDRSEMERVAHDLNIIIPDSEIQNKRL